MITQEMLDDAILDNMGRPDWEIIAQFLVAEALRTRDACADADSWEAVNYNRGFADALAYVVNLRDTTKRAKEQESLDANV
jgi:S-adenosylhomocysteine hydrolase